MKKFTLHLLILVTMPMAVNSQLSKKSNSIKSVTLDTKNSLLELSLDILTDGIGTLPAPQVLRMYYDTNAKITLRNLGNNKTGEIISISSLKDKLNPSSPAIPFNGTVKFYFISISNQISIGCNIGSKFYLIDNGTLFETSNITTYVQQYNGNQKIALDVFHRTPNGQTISVNVHSNDLKSMINEFDQYHSTHLELKYSQLDSTVDETKFVPSLTDSAKKKYAILKRINHNNISFVFIPMVKVGEKIIINTSAPNYYDVSDICPPTCNN